MIFVSVNGDDWVLQQRNDVIIKRFKLSDGKMYQAEILLQAGGSYFGKLEDSPEKAASHIREMEVLKANDLGGEDE